jgi:suppressor for copper-sensitivity B
MAFFITFMSGIAGGIILNIMPCVLPALFSKAYHIIKLKDQNHQEKLGQKKIDEIFFLLGILVTFSALAIFVIILKSSGKSLGWGMQMQNPIFVGILAIATYLFAISNFGLLDLNMGFSHGGKKTARLKSFFDGMFITLISTPCSAPILGTATTYALSKESSVFETLALFWSIGLGLALPSLAFTFISPLAKIIPKPGQWADYFKTFVGYTLVAASIWLFSVYSRLVDSSQMIDMLYLICAMTLVLHLRKEMSVALKDQNGVDRYDDQGIAISFLSTHPVTKALFYLLSMSLIALLLNQLYPPSQFEKITQQVSVNQKNHLPWEPFNEAKIKDYLSKNKPVFVDFTADWCVSCKTFEKAHLNTKEMIDLIDETKLITMQADLTEGNDDLWDFLAKYHRSGIPAYFLFSPDGSIDLLPEGPPLGLADKIKALSLKYPVNQMKN